jgi:NAD-dependent SIR2 family protein deacetylase
MDYAFCPKCLNLFKDTDSDFYHSNCPKCKAQGLDPEYMIYNMAKRMLEKDKKFYEYLCGERIFPPWKN